MERQEPEFPDEAHQEWLEDIVSEARDLDDWERDFVNDLIKYKKRIVSRKQERVLERILLREKL